MPLNYSTVTDAITEPITLALAKAQCRVDAGFAGDDTLFNLYIPAARRWAEKFMRRAIFNQVWQRTLDNFPLAASFDYSPTPADRWNWPVFGGMWNRLTIDLPGGACRQIRQITYNDVNGSPVVLTPSLYAADLSSVPCRVTPADGLVWPWQGTYLPGSVQIQYEVGSFVSAASETFTVPSVAPYTLSLQNGKQPPNQLTAIESITQVIGGVVTPVTGWTLAGGVLTLPASLAGAVLTVNECLAACPEDIQIALLLMVGHLYRNPEATSDLKLEEIPMGAQSFLRPHVVEWTDYRPA